MTAQGRELLELAKQLLGNRPAVVGQSRGPALAQEPTGKRLVDRALGETEPREGLGAVRNSVERRRHELDVEIEALGARRDR